MRGTTELRGAEKRVETSGFSLLLNYVQRCHRAARRLLREGMLPLFGLASVVLVTSAHIGSPDVWTEGKAGPYPVTVNVQVPGVVPGIANVYVRVEGDGVQQVLASGNTFDATGGAPPPEVAKPVSGTPGLYHVPLWMMTPGSSSVTVTVRGSRGEGKILVPVVIVAHQRLLMNRPLGIGLGIVGIVLFLGAISVVGAAAREAGLAAGERPGPQQRRKGLLAKGIAVLAFVVLLFGGWTWWNAEDAKFVKTLYQPMTSESRVRVDGGVPYLDVVITDKEWLDRHHHSYLTRRKAALFTPLVPDHGKLMHAFVIRESDMNVLAHIHPSTTDSITFSTMLPPLPPGEYRVLADLVRESGYTETLTSTVTISRDVATMAEGEVSLRKANTDPDDAWLVGSASLEDSTMLAPDIVLHWRRGTTSITENLPAPLEFSVTTATGAPVALEPYMGMLAHAMVMRDDGSVFVHLHPTGTVSMAAQETFTMRQATDTAPGMVAQRMQSEEGEDVMSHAQHMMGTMTQHVSKTNSTREALPSQDISQKIRFPYAFPKAGQYRIWVQVKTRGQILTGAFVTTVGTQTSR